MNKIMKRDEYDKLTDEQKCFANYMLAAQNSEIPENRPDDVDPIAWERGQFRGVLLAIDGEE